MGCVITTSVLIHSMLFVLSFY